MPRRKPESPVNIGDTVFVVDDRTFEVHEVKVDSNPSEIIWATLPGKRSRSSEAFGPHRWSKTRAEAERQSKELAKQRRSLTENA